MNGNKIDGFEIRRKTFHICVGLFISLMVYLDLVRWWFVLLLIILAIPIVIFYKKYDIPLIDYFLKRFDRPEHLKKTPAKGVMFLLIGLFILVIFFDKNIIIASILIWAFGDSFSAILGKHYGRYRHPLNNKKFIEGTLFGIIAGGIAASFFVPWYLAFLASFVAINIESLDLKIYDHIIDDNLLIPVISALILRIFML